MSIGLIWLTAIIIFPIIGLYLLKVNAALVYLSLCLGYVLYIFDAHNAGVLAGSLNAHSSLVHLKASTVVVNFALLLGPAALTLISQINSLHGKSKRFLNLVPTIVTGLFIPLLVVPILPASTAESIIKTSYWAQLIKYRASIVGVGAVVAILFFWLNGRESTKKKHHSSKE